MRIQRHAANLAPTQPQRRDSKRTTGEAGRIVFQNSLVRLYVSSAALFTLVLIGAPGPALSASVDTVVLWSAVSSRPASPDGQFEVEPAETSGSTIAGALLGLEIPIEAYRTGLTSKEIVEFAARSMEIGADFYKDPAIWDAISEKILSGVDPIKAQDEILAMGFGELMGIPEAIYTTRSFEDLLVGASDIQSINEDLMGEFGAWEDLDTLAPKDFVREYAANSPEGSTEGPNVGTASGSGTGTGGDGGDGSGSDGSSGVSGIGGAAGTGSSGSSSSSDENGSTPTGTALVFNSTTNDDGSYSYESDIYDANGNFMGSYTTACSDGTCTDINDDTGEKQTYEDKSGSAPRDGVHNINTNSSESSGGSDDDKSDSDGYCTGEDPNCSEDQTFIPPTAPTLEETVALTCEYQSTVASFINGYNCDTADLRTALEGEDPLPDEIIYPVPEEAAGSGAPIVWVPVVDTLIDPPELATGGGDGTIDPYLSSLDDLLSSSYDETTQNLR